MVKGCPCSDKEERGRGYTCRERKRERERERGKREVCSKLSAMVNVKSPCLITHSLPKNVPQKNGMSRTPMIGEARLINQFGRNGVIYRNMMYHSMLSWWRAACALQDFNLSGKYFLTSPWPTIEERT